MDDEQILNSHLSQLGATRSPLYSQLAALNEASQRLQAAQLIDFILSEQLSAPRQLPPADALGTLVEALKKAHPDRKCVEFILAKFSGWVEAVAAHARETFLNGFAELAPAARDLGDAGMKKLLEAMAAEPAVLKPVAAYAMTTAEAIQALAEMAAQAARCRRLDLLEAFAKAFPAEEMEKSRDAEHLPPAVGKMTQAAKAWPEAMQLALALIERDVSSARGTCGDLAGVMGKMPAADHAPYLDDFRLIIEAMGIRAAGYSLRTLPNLYRRHGAAAVRRFVSLACQAANEAGAVAGEAFLERKTEASLIF
ncbi:MAG: hypothetical protein FJW20_02835 [Acidimicrobiia bacterium]|nr:hypothetical protein [Acidimicrobiia bacterium]